MEAMTNEEYLREMAAAGLKKPRYQRERNEQIALIAVCNVLADQVPELEHVFHVPNGGYRPVRVAAQMKRMGTRKGMPDLYLDVPRHGYHGLRIEMKAPAGASTHKKRAGRASDQQSAELEWLAAQGYRVWICFGAGEAMYALLSYLGRLDVWNEAKRRLLLHGCEVHDGD